MTIAPGGAESTECYWPFPVCVFTLVTVCLSGSPPGTELSNIIMNSARSRWDREPVPAEFQLSPWIFTVHSLTVVSFVSVDQTLRYLLRLTDSGQTRHSTDSQLAGLREQFIVSLNFILDNVQYISCECSVQNLHTILIFMICLTTSIILWLDKSWNCQHYEEIRKGKLCSSWCVRRGNLISNLISLRSGEC